MHLALALAQPFGLVFSFAVAVRTACSNDGIAAKKKEEAYNDGLQIIKCDRRNVGETNIYVVLARGETMATFQRYTIWHVQAATIALVETDGRVHCA